MDLNVTDHFCNFFLDTVSRSLRTQRQLDLFAPAAPSDTQISTPAAPAAPIPEPLTGLAVKTPSQCRCGSDVAFIGDGTEIHRASLRCRGCRRHRGWLSKFTADWIEQVVAKFGAPEIITLRGPRL